jgi:hypothetical protein
VLRVDRVGAYPDVQWKHWLECQHFELRKRKAPADRIGCTACLNRTEDKEAGVDVIPDLEGERLRVRAMMEKAFDNPMFSKAGVKFNFDDIEVVVEDVDGQAQVRLIRMSMNVPKDLAEFMEREA